MLLNIKDLHARIEEREILKGLNLQINPGEVHAIMGPNGAGKSTLSSYLLDSYNYYYLGNYISQLTPLTITLYSDDYQTDPQLTPKKT